MATKEAVMTTQEVANRFQELARARNWGLVQDELFAENAVSIEPAHAEQFPTIVEGIAGIKEKGKQFATMVEEVHGGYSGEPQVAGSHFSVALGMDCTLKGMGRTKMDEIAVYEVKDGKIVKEQFFY